jgi:hypothetical protein
MPIAKFVRSNKMIETISLAKTATYGDQPEVLGPLRCVNFIFGTNGTGKTTISRVIPNGLGYAPCGVVWKDGLPMQALVYKRDFVERDFSRSAELEGGLHARRKAGQGQEEIKEKKQVADGCKDKVAPGAAHWRIAALDSALTNCPHRTDDVAHSL